MSKTPLAARAAFRHCPSRSKDGPWSNGKMSIPSTGLSDDEVRIGGGGAARAGGLPFLLRVSEAARLLSCSRSRLYELISAGVIESVKDGRSRRIVTRSAVDYVEDLRAAF